MALKQVSKDEFDAFIASYPRRLEYDVNRAGEAAYRQLQRLHAGRLAKVRSGKLLPLRSERGVLRRRGTAMEDQNMTNECGRLTPGQLKKMGAAEMADFLRRNSGDENFHWQVREAVLNRAAELLERCAWIPVSERLPEATEENWSDDVEVLAKNRRDGEVAHFIAWYRRYRNDGSNDGEWELPHDVRFVSEDVTDWRPVIE